MSKTERFNVTVVAGASGVTYPPGKPVPVGGKHGIDEDEVKRLRETFGDWTGPDDAAPPVKADLETAALRENLQAAHGERDKLQAEVDRLTAETDRLTSELAAIESDRSQGLDDNAALAGEIERLKKENADLAGQVEKLTKPKT